MKYSLTISDMTDDEFKQTLAGIGIGAAAALTEQPSYEQDDDAGADATGDLDSTGLPWDGRIHASSKKQNKDGTWKSRKGVDDAARTQIEGELRAQTKAASLPAGATPFADLSAFTVSQPPTAPAAQPVFQPPAPPAPQPTYAPTGQSVYQPQPPMAPAPQAAPATGNTFQSLMQKFQELLMAKKIAPNFAMEIVGYLNQTFGTQCNSITDISGNQAMIDASFQYIASRVQ